MIWQKTTAGGDTAFELVNTNSAHEHGVIVPIGPPDLHLVPHIFGDIEGVQHMIGKPGEQRVMCRVTYVGFTTYNVAMGWINLLYRKTGQLTGEITLQRGPLNWTSPPATFVGFTCTQPPFEDGSGVHRWIVMGTLFWILRGPYVPALG